MKVLTWIVLISAMITNLAIAQPNASVPFQNVLLGPGRQFTASFAFGTFPFIFCFANDDRSVVNLTWPVNRKPLTARLPLALTIKSGVIDARRSDANGTLTLTNLTSDRTVSTIVSCLFAL